MNKLIDKQCKEAKEKWLQQKCEDIDRMASLNQSRAMHKKAKEITRQDKTSGAVGGIKDKQGNMLFEKEDIKERWAEYIAELFYDDREDKPEIEGDDGPYILLSEVGGAFYHMKYGKRIWTRWRNCRVSEGFTQRGCPNID